MLVLCWIEVYGTSQKSFEPLSIISGKPDSKDLQTRRYMMEILYNLRKKSVNFNLLESDIRKLLFFGISGGVCVVYAYPDIADYGFACVSFAFGTPRILIIVVLRHAPRVGQYSRQRNDCTFEFYRQRKRKMVEFLSH